LLRLLHLRLRHPLCLLPKLSPPLLLFLLLRL
jgi:hypothetical protein